LTGSLRHAQLDAVEAPKRPESLISQIRLMTGTLWHTWLHDAMRRLGVPYLAEVNLTPWMPPGWGGTADALIWNPDLKAFVLADFKTTKGEGMRYLGRDGAKEEHKAQTSLYWHAAKKMGLPLAKAVAVFYLPMNDTRGKDEVIEPLLVDFAPIPARQLHGEAKRRQKRVDAYRESLPKPNPRPLELDEYLTDALEPVQERTQRLYFDRDTETWDLKLVAHWSAAFCPFPDGLCDCSAQPKQTKIGTYDVDGVTYYPRKGYEDVEPEVRPS
jgi:hypothetical protein